jgi:uncharacterized protein YqeY
MSSPIKDSIVEDMKNAMRSQDKERLATIRLILAALKQREVDDRVTLADDDVLAILNKMVKQRRDSITQFTAGNRTDLAAIEEKEIKVISHYLPQQLSAEEITAAVATAIAESKATSPKDMGKVMAILKAKLDGVADMSLVSAQVKGHLTG